MGHVRQARSKAAVCGTALCHEAGAEISRGDLKQRIVRVGDAERDACTAVLIDHHLHGRLSIEELERRQRAALAAVTEGASRSCWRIFPRASLRPNGARDGLPSGKHPMR